MAARAEESIVVGSQNSNTTTIAKHATVASNRSNRATKPTAKIQEKANRDAEDDGESGTPEATEKSRDGGAAKTYLQKILELVAHSRTEIQDLKQMAVAQSDTIGSQEGLIRGLSEQYEASKQENQRMAEELKLVREQLEIQNSPALNISAQTSPQVSYAGIARTPPTSQPSNVRTLSSMNTTPTSFTDTLYCTIDTSHLGDDERANVAAGTVQNAIEKDMRATEEHKEWRCRAVMTDPRKPQRIKIVCRDEAEHRLVKRAAEKTAVHGARVLRDELYPIKVDSVKRTAVLDENDQLRDGAAEAFGQENETSVAKIVFILPTTAARLAKEGTTLPAKHSAQATYAGVRRLRTTAIKEHFVRWWEEASQVCKRYRELVYIEATVKTPKELKNPRRILHNFLRSDQDTGISTTPERPIRLPNATNTGTSSPLPKNAKTPSPMAEV